MSVVVVSFVQSMSKLKRQTLVILKFNFFIFLYTLIKFNLSKTAIIASEYNATHSLLCVLQAKELN